MDEKIRRLVARLDGAYANHHLDEFEAVELIARDILTELEPVHPFGGLDAMYVLCVEGIAWLLGGRPDHPRIRDKLQLAATLADRHSLQRLHMLALWYGAIGEILAMFPPDELATYTIEGVERCIDSLRDVAALAAELDDPFREGLVYSTTADLQVWALEPHLAAEFAGIALERFITARGIDTRTYTDPRTHLCLLTIREITSSKGTCQPAIKDFRPFLYHPGELTAPK